MYNKSINSFVAEEDTLLTKRSILFGLYIMKICSKCLKALPLEKFSLVGKHYQGKYRSRCRGCVAEYHKSFYNSHWKDYMRNYRKRFPIKHKAIQERFYLNRKQKRAITRLDVLGHYSKGKPKCACCGETEVVFLAIDHKNGGGRKHLRELGKSSLTPFWFVKNNFPKDFQILCHNCNFGKYRCGVCPHLSKIKVQTVGIKSKQLT